MQTVKLLKRYGGFPKGALVDVADDDACKLIEENIAREPQQNDAAQDDNNSDIADEVYNRVRAELNTGVKSPPFEMSGNYAAENFGPQNPKKFWTTNIGSDFDAFAENLKAIEGASKGQWDSRLKDLATTSNTTGGHLIPMETANWIYMQMLEANPFMSRATLLPMTSGSIKVPFIAEASREDSGMHGIGTGKGAPHVAEGGALVDISPEFGACQLNLHKIGGRCRITNEMLEDSGPALSVLLPRLFADAINFRMFHEFINGSGAGECLGVLTGPATISVTKEAGQAADTILTENIVKMFSRLLPEAQRNCIWLCSLSTLPQLLTLSISVGTGGSYVWLVQGNRDGAGLANAAPVTILGRPVFFTEHCPPIGDFGDIIAADLRSYAIGRKLNAPIRIEVSEHARFENDQIVYRALTRIDGQPLMANAITPANGGDTLSAFVALEERT